MIRLDNIHQTYRGPKGPVHALRGGDADTNKPWVAKLVKAYHSPEIKQFIQTEFKGSVLAGF